MTVVCNNLAAGRWNTLSITAQMGNIGSEYERILNWRRKGKPDLAQAALKRMLELFDLTLSDKRWNRYRLDEIARAREVVCDEIKNAGLTGGFSKYFYYLSVLARRERGLA